MEKGASVVRCKRFSSLDGGYTVRIGCEVYREVMMSQTHQSGRQPDLTAFNYFFRNKATTLGHVIFTTDAHTEKICMYTSCTCVHMCRVYRSTPVQLPCHVHLNYYHFLRSFHCSVPYVDSSC